MVVENGWMNGTLHRHRTGSCSSFRHYSGSIKRNKKLMVTVLCSYDTILLKYIDDILFQCCVLVQIQQLEMQVMDAEKRAFTAHQQVRFPATVCVCVCACAYKCVHLSVPFSMFTLMNVEYLLFPPSVQNAGSASKKVN